MKRNMTTNDAQEQGGSDPVPTAAPEQTIRANASRRQFAKAGLGVSGVILSLASRPVLGNVVCKSPSGFLSGNASTHGPQPVCQGRSPGYWKNHQGAWPIATTTRFGSVFPANPSSPYANFTFLELIQEHQKEDKHNLGRHLAAAYLNAVRGWTPFLPVETIVAMFAEWQSKGAYSPKPGVQWTGAEIVAYIEATYAVKFD